MVQIDRAGRVRAAGGVVCRPTCDGDVEVLLVHRPRYGDWTIPKGKAEYGESDQIAALREVAEETGLICLSGEELESSEYVDREGRTKVVRYWLMSPVSGSLRENDEVDGFSWVRIADAGSRATYETDRQILDAAERCLSAQIEIAAKCDCTSDPDRPAHAASADVDPGVMTTKSAAKRR